MVSIYPKIILDIYELSCIIQSPPPQTPLPGAANENHSHFDSSFDSFFSFDLPLLSLFDSLFLSGLRFLSLLGLRFDSHSYFALHFRYCLRFRYRLRLYSYYRLLFLFRYRLRLSYHYQPHYQMRTILIYPPVPAHPPDENDSYLYLALASFYIELLNANDSHSTLLTWHNLC